MSETLALRGTLKAHTNWVTCLATTVEQSDVLLSGSRDKMVIMWTLDGSEAFGVPRKSLKGHSHYIEDVCMSSDGQFALSGSWDGTLRLWDLNTGQTTRRFVSHEKDVLSVAFSADNRQIVSGARDKTWKLWNTLGECKWTSEAQARPPPLRPSSRAPPLRHTSHYLRIVRTTLASPPARLPAPPPLRSLARAHTSTRDAPSQPVSARALANVASHRTGTPSGSRACASRRRPPTRSSSRAAGTSSSRCGT